LNTTIPAILELNDFSNLETFIGSLSKLKITDNNIKNQLNTIIIKYCDTYNINDSDTILQMLPNLTKLTNFTWFISDKVEFNNNMLDVLAKIKSIKKIHFVTRRNHKHESLIETIKQIRLTNTYIEIQFTHFNYKFEEYLDQFHADYLINKKWSIINQFFDLRNTNLYNHKNLQKLRI
jgi:hypothetical protein